MASMATPKRSGKHSIYRGSRRPALEARGDRRWRGELSDFPDQDESQDFIFLHISIQS